MSVKVLLTEHVPGLGSIGDEANVADGYARNYLFPRNMAVMADDHKGKSAAHKGLMRQLELKKSKFQEQYEREIAEFARLAEEINNQSLTVPVHAQEDGKLYGSVGNQQIVASLKELGIDIDRQKVALTEPIREVGTHTVDIHLHPEVTASVKVSVVKVEG